MAYQPTAGAAMNATITTTGFVLRYDSLYTAGRRFSFPCDESGAIDLDALPPRARSNYLAMRARVGLEYAFPVVEPVAAP
jgi:hypothetical protein